ncbi:hypothetical protein B0H34DRAFT_425108 [Crassisporium funariophilum]|nr:hypothetical protein B0H34DRAFT_425108 [Crassisporium funariophilum]
MNKRRPSSPLPLEMKIQKQRVSALTFVGPCGHNHKSVDQSIISAYQDIIDTTTTTGKILMALIIFPQCDMISPEFRDHTAFRASWEEIYKQHTEEIDEIWIKCASDKSFDRLRSVEQLRKSHIASQSSDTVLTIAEVKATELAWKSEYKDV